MYGASDFAAAPIAARFGSRPGMLNCADADVHTAPAAIAATNAAKTERRNRFMQHAFGTVRTRSGLTEAGATRSRQAAAAPPPARLNESALRVRDPERSPKLPAIR